MRATISLPNNSTEHESTIFFPLFSTVKSSQDTLNESINSSLNCSLPRTFLSNNRTYCTSCRPNAVTREIMRRISPSCKATSRRPTLVSRTTLVVNTLVFPAILPPTIKTAPTSAIALPNPRRIALVIPRRAQYISKKIRCFGLAFITRNTSRFSEETRSSAVHETPRISGKINRVCATIIPCIVNNQLSEPKTPSLLKAM